MRAPLKLCRCGGESWTVWRKETQAWVVECCAAERGCWAPVSAPTMEDAVNLWNAHRDSDAMLARKAEGFEPPKGVAARAVGIARILLLRWDIYSSCSERRKLRKRGWYRRRVKA